MIKYLLAFIISALLLSFTHQTLALDMKYIGVKAGVNLSNTTGNDAVNTDQIMRFTVGGFAIFDFMRKTKIRAEILYIQKGATAKFVNEALSLNETLNFKSSYIEIPILFQHNLPSRDRNNVVNVFMGPSIGLLVTADTNGTDVKDEMAVAEIGFHIGGGTTIDRKYTVDVRYSMGLTSAADDSDNADFKNTGIMATIGYLFK